MAKGYSQEYGVDYEETYAPTVKLTTIRVLMSIAAQRDMLVHQMDVKSAYLNADIDRDVYMEQAEGYNVMAKDGTKLVYKLNKSLYGLKQSGRNWNAVLNKFLCEIGFKRSNVDPCLYIKGEIEMGYIPTDKNVADIFTKPSSVSKLNDFKEHVFGKL